MSITYVTGDATRPIGAGPKLICHVCNDRGGWGKGFVLALSKRWPEPEQYYRRWCAASKSNLLGLVQCVAVDDEITVANMVAQEGYRKTKHGHGLPLRYDALALCLWSVRRWIDDHVVAEHSVHMPRTGTGLGGGHWERIEPMIEKYLGVCSVTVYDLPR